MNLSNGLVAHYDFNGNANDVSGNGHHGTPFGSTLSSDRSGSIDQAYSFDGNDYITVPHHSNLNFGFGDFSISLWINTTNTTKQMILQKGGNLGPAEAQYWIRDNDNSAHLFRHLTSDGNPPSPNVFASSLGLHDGAWHHIATIRQGSELEMYFDGCLIATDNTNGRNINSAIQLIIGAQNDWGGMGIHNFFTGFLDEIRFYDRVLNPEEILTLAESQTLTTINAGQDFETCTNNTQLDADPITIGSGSWRVLQGQATVDNPGDPKSTVQNLSTGTNSFEWTLTNGCESKIDTTNITMLPVPTTPNAGSDIQICAGTNAALQANSPIEGTGQWSISQGAGIFSDGTSPNSNVSGLSIGINRFKWTIFNNCDSLQDEVIVEVNSALNEPLGSDRFICPGASIFLDATTPDATYLWNNGLTNPVIEISDPGDYWVEISQPGCSFIDSVTVSFTGEPGCEQSLIFHNAFNPHSNTEANRSFYLHNPNVVAKLEVFIFNRWGEIVFHSNDKNFMWSGDYKDKTSPSNLYAYKVIYYLSDNQLDPFTLYGDVYLMN